MVGKPLPEESVIIAYDGAKNESRTSKEVGTAASSSAHPREAPSSAKEHQESEDGQHREDE